MVNKYEPYITQHVSRLHHPCFAIMNRTAYSNALLRFNIIMVGRQHHGEQGAGAERPSSWRSHDSWCYFLQVRPSPCLPYVLCLTLPPYVVFFLQASKSRG
jgi:hypothetical protein